MTAAKFTLRDYQEKDVQFFSSRKGSINANDPGLGKTLESLETANRVGFETMLIISPVIAKGVWKQEAEKWFDWECMLMPDVAMRGNAQKRQKCREDFDRSDVRILIINYEQLAEVLQWRPHWNVIVADEIHLPQAGWLNHKSAKYKVAKKMKYDYLMLLSGTIIRKNLADLYAPLHLLNPKVFYDYWPFVNKYCVTVSNGFGKEIMRRPKEPQRFKALLDRYLIRRRKQDVIAELPDKIRQSAPIYMNKVQEDIYKQLEAEMIAAHDGDIVVAQSVLVRDLRYRQLLVTPRLLGIDDDGASIKALIEYYIPMMVAAGRPMVLATPFRQALPFIEEAIRKAFPKMHIEQIHGQIKEPAATVAQRFQNHRDPQKILLYSIKAGASWTAHTANVGFMLHYEWSTSEQIQAEDRIWRLGQKNTVHWYYFQHEGTIDDQVLTALADKREAEEWVMRPEAMIARREQLRQQGLKKL